MLYSINFNNETEDETSYVSNVKTLTFENLVKKMKSKDHVLVVSCYYGIDALNKFLKKMVGRNRSTTVIVSAVGSSSQNWLSQVRMLLDEKNGIDLHQRQNVFLYTRHSLLHSKIYLSKSSRKDWPGQAQCLVGSANLSNNAFDCNEEVLADIVDCKTKKAINAYIETILRDKEHLFSLRDLKKQYTDEGTFFDLESILNQKENSITTLADYFLSGKLFFKCVRNFSLGFGDRDWRSEISETSESGFIKKNKTLNVSYILDCENYDTVGDNDDDIVENAEFDENEKYEDDELEINSETEYDNQANNKKNIMSIRSNSVETCFGYWVPKDRLHVFKNLTPYCQSKKSPQKAKYEIIHKALEENSINLTKKVNDRLNKAFEEVSLPSSRYDFYKNKIRDHIKQRKDFYEKNMNLYLMKGFCITPMPNIFDDPVATQEFLESLWDDIRNRSKDMVIKKKTEEKTLSRKLFSLLVDTKSLDNKMLDLTSPLNDLESFL